MTEEFDPRKHRLFSVEVVITSWAPVVAESAKAAEMLALEIPISDLVLDAHRETYASEQDDYHSVDFPWGPIRYEGRELNATEIIELIKNPPNKTEHFVDTAMPLSTYTAIPEIDEWAARRGFVLRSTKEDIGEEDA